LYGVGLSRECIQYRNFYAEFPRVISDYQLNTTYRIGKFPDILYVSLHWLFIHGLYSTLSPFISLYGKGPTLRRSHFRSRKATSQTHKEQSLLLAVSKEKHTRGIDSQDSETQANIRTNHGMSNPRQDTDNHNLKGRKNAGGKKNLNKVLTLPSTSPLKLEARPHVLLLCGLPGSGKSTLARRVMELDDSYVRVNQDELKKRIKCERAAKRTLAEGKCPIIDRTNFDVTQRAHFVKIAQELNVPINCIMLGTPKEECIRRAQSRAHHETISPRQAVPIINMICKDCVTPSQVEGFHGLQYLDGTDSEATESLVASLVKSNGDK